MKKLMMLTMILIATSAMVLVGCGDTKCTKDTCSRHPSSGECHCHGRCSNDTCDCHGDH